MQIYLVPLNYTNNSPTFLIIFETHRNTPTHFQCVTNKTKNRRIRCAGYISSFRGGRSLRSTPGLTDSFRRV